MNEQMDSFCFDCSIDDILPDENYYICSGGY